RGILTTTAVPIPPLAGDASTSPLLSFTHTLLHQHLLMLSEGEADSLARLVAGHSPLYSTVPFQVLGRSASQVDGTNEHALRAIIQVFDTTFYLVGQGNSRNACDMVEVARHLVDMWGL